MSAFLSSTRPTQRERDAEKAMAYSRWETAKRCYKWASFLVVVAMIVIAAPKLGLAQWNWHIVGGAGGVITLLAIVMMVKGSMTNGLISLVFAWGILPGWIYAAPKVVEVGYAQYQVIASEWDRTMGSGKPKVEEKKAPEPEKKAEVGEGK